MNQHLVYTHGYGSVLTPTAAVAPDGNPEFRIKDMPPVSTLGAPTLEQPAIYFGEDLPSYAIVNTKQQEIDYTDEPTAPTSHHRSTPARPACQMDSFLRRRRWPSASTTSTR